MIIVDPARFIVIVLRQLHMMYNSMYNYEILLNIGF